MPTTRHAACCAHSERPRSRAVDQRGELPALRGMHSATLAQLAQALPAAVLNDTGTLPQRNGLAWPAQARSTECRQSYVEIFDPGNVLNDSIAVVVPTVDAEGKM